jgi:toxin CcdB
MQSQTAPRKPTNLTLDPSLLTEARSFGVNLSQAAEEGLRACRSRGEGASLAARECRRARKLERVGRSARLASGEIQAVLMARFEVFANPGGAGYVLDVQADVLSELNTRIVAPLLPLTQAPVPADRLNPVFEIGDAPHVMVTQFMAAVPSALLRSPVTSLMGQDNEIMAALDMVLVGF